jgi:predicted RNase H-like HicB family nuclease
MTGRLSFTAVYEQVENGWTQARIEQLPAVVTAAPTAAEAKELLVDALSEYLLSLGTPDQPSPPAGPAQRLPFEIVINAA